MLPKEIDTDIKNDLPEMEGELVEIYKFDTVKGAHYPHAALAYANVPGGTVKLLLYAEHRRAIKDAGYTFEDGQAIPVTMKRNRRIGAVLMPDGQTWVEVDDDRDNDRQPPAPVLVPRPVQEDEPDPCAERALTGQAMLYKKMAQVMGKMQRIPKTGFNEHFKYKYVTEGDIADAVRAAMSEVGLAFFTEILEYHREGTEVSKRDQKGAAYTKTAYTTYLKLMFTFACADTGAMMNKIWYSEADDDQDKGISKAVTLAQKYFLKSTFIISTGDPADDPDSGISGKPPRQRQQGRDPQPKSSPVPSGAKAANGGQSKPAAPPVKSGAWQFTDQTVTDLMFESKDWPQSRPERMNTINAMRTEGAFDGCTGLDAAAALFNLRLQTHHEPDLSAPPEDEADGAK